MILSLSFFTSLTPLVCITLPFTQPCHHCSNSPAAFAVTTSRRHWHHHLAFLLHRFLDFCSTLCVISLFIIARASLALLSVVFVARLGLAQWNCCLHPRSVSGGLCPHLLSSHPALSHTIPSFAAYQNCTTWHLYCILTTHVCCGGLESTALSVCPLLSC